MEDLLLDVRYALRALRQSSAFTLVAILTLMLGIGANVLVFGVVNAVLLRPLEVGEPHNLYQLRLKPWTSGKALTTSYPAVEDYRQRNATFSGSYAGACRRSIQTHAGRVRADMAGNGIQPPTRGFSVLCSTKGFAAQAFIILCPCGFPSTSIQ